MKVSVKDAGTCRKTMKIEIPADKIAEEREETLKAYAKNVSIPGFRKGKAPKAVVAHKFEKEITKDMEERLVPKYYHEALQEKPELKVVMVVDVSDVAIKDGQPLEFDITMDVEPEFKLPKYDGISLTEDKEDVTDEKVQERIDMIRSQHANYEEVEGQPVAEGGMAQLSYEAEVDGRPLAEIATEAKGIGSGNGYWISADEHAFLPGMGEAIVGMNIGDKKDVEVEFPAEFIVKELAGIKALYKIEITGIRERTLPEIDATFLSRLQLESEEQLRTQVREEMERSSEAQDRNKKQEQIIAYLIKKTKLDVPESMIQQQTRNMMYDIARQRMMMGQTQEQLQEAQEDVLKEAQERALENVKLRYIGLGIADDLKLEASANEVSEEIASMAIQQRRDAQELRKEMEENDTLESVGDQIRFNKAMDYMLENAKVK
ncbi:MAG: trigger factor [Kiritimatiellales bacterium]|nr:trigger factor [Kiritimatiellales bacterium]